MIQAQNIECLNRAAFVMSFRVSKGELSTDSTDAYPVLQSRSRDLAASTFEVGATVWPVVKAGGGKTLAASQQVVFALNETTAVYEVRGTTQEFEIHFLRLQAAQPGPRLAGFPPGIPLNLVPYGNWDGTITARQIWTCAPRDAADAVAACNWAARNGYTVRPRGIMHNWSPLTIAPGAHQALADVLLIDTTKSLHGMSMLPASDGFGPRVRVGSGATTGELMAFLERQPGGKGAAPGFGVAHLPAPDHLTVGGVLAINGHGTAVPTAPHDNFPTTYGSMSNRVLELSAVVTDPANPGAYALKTFTRGDADMKAFLTHLGRAFIVDATLQVVDNFNLRCVSHTDIDAGVLFRHPSGAAPDPQSCADFLARSGRIEVIWFPFTRKPWLKVWTVEPTRPAGSIEVTQPNNYTFSDQLPDEITDIVKGLTRIPGATVVFGEAMRSLTSNALDGKGFLGNPGAYPVSRDIWGTSRNTLFYVRDTTLRVTANGYAILMNRADVQQGIADFTTQFETMLEDYRRQGKYPINSPLEIRVTGLDSAERMPSTSGGRAERPVLSSLATDAETERNRWDVALWLDVLTLPGTAHAEAFFAEMEAWIVAHFKAPTARVVPEWSKGWAYTDPGGPWTDAAFMNRVRAGFTTGRASDDNWDWAAATLARYDRQRLFRSPLLDTLFAPPSA